jgi:hypothetical protein
MSLVSRGRKGKASTMIAGNFRIFEVLGIQARDG